MKDQLDYSDIVEAQKRISGIALKTPNELSHSCTKWLGVETYLKFENHQRTGSFKIRGALNKILSLDEKSRKRGVVAASAGNHAQGVAFSATYVGAKSHIVMPMNSPVIKVAATEGYGANVVLYGEMFDESYQKARELEEEKGYVFVHPFEDPAVIAGQGTVGLEILDEIPDVDSVIVAIGGGGLISGVATAIKEKRPECKVFGAVSEYFSGMKAMYYGEELPVYRGPSIADGIAVKNPSQNMFDSFIKEKVDGIVSVSEDDMAGAIVFLLERAKTVVEASGAIALAAAANAGWDLGKKTCVILCGGNIDLNLISKTIEMGLSKAGRITRLAVITDDRPGSLLSVTNIISGMGANILDVHHNRATSNLALNETEIHFMLETRSPAHAQKIRSALEKIDLRVV